MRRKSASIAELSRCGFSSGRRSQGPPRLDQRGATTSAPTCHLVKHYLQRDRSAARCHCPCGRHALRIVAKIDPVDEDYFTEKIQPLLRDPLVEFVGAIGEAQKEEFLGNACAYLFPINWPEPFGITMIETMACEPPVIAMSYGVNSRGRGRRAHRVHLPIHGRDARVGAED